MTLLAIMTVMLYVLVATVVFRFQRTTLAIARQYAGKANGLVNLANIQVVMTPTAMGFLGFLSTFLLVASIVLTYIAFGIWASLVVVIYAFVLQAWVDLFSPLPTYDWCFRIIENELKRSTPADSQSHILALRLPKAINETKHLQKQSKAGL